MATKKEMLSNKKEYYLNACLYGIKPKKWLIQITRLSDNEKFEFYTTGSYLNKCLKLRHQED